MTNNLDTLKSLTQTTRDSVEGYKKAIEKAESPAIKSALQNRCQSRERVLEQLNAELEKNGCERVTDNSMASDAHQMFMSIADAFESGDEAAIERVEEGEDYIAGKFREAMEDGEVDPSFRQVIQQAYQDVQAGERFSDMLDKQYS
ncbi:ferritin-like domain-containing protein [Qipengyuania nanhaisediminis]|uniref:ferritin-like domain-containing protein n=1 Tax=Qipengyuania nanhaisediminis TaxID=604088 RepID=UPI0038B28D66